MKQKENSVKQLLLRITKLHAFIVLAYIAQIIAYDASKLITPEVVLDRWFAVAGLAAAAAAVYYLARSWVSRTPHYQLLTWMLITADIAFATFNVYTQRGMASKAVLLFIIPILVSAILMSRAALITTAILSAAAYTTASVAYFVNFFNEGYKIELYGEILFYSAVLLISSSLLWVFIPSKGKR
jgi:hypothetical protein